MDPRIIPYIKKYLHDGHQLSEIEQSLIKQGISESDIKEAAIIAMQEGTIEVKKKHHYVVWIIVPIILVLIIGGYLIFQDTIKSVTSKEISFEKEIINDSQECDINCVIKAAAICEPSKTTYTTQTDFFGIVITKESYYEIRKGSKCELYIKSINNDVEFSENLKKQSLANGISSQELDIQILTSKTDIQTLNGKEVVCLFEDTSQLKKFLEKIRDDTFSGVCTSGNCINDDDWKLGECSGSMFTQ